MGQLVKNNVYWIGKVDWELRRFHGEELSTHHGSTYNSYLIKEEKTVLIDTVWKPFSEEFLRDLPRRVDVKKIDAVVLNHAEIDHAGAVPDLMEHLPGVPVYCTNNGVKSLRGHYHQEWNFRPVRTGETLDVGNGKKLVFIEAPMLHWPDSMFTYLTGDNILFSNDAFGQHLATDKIWADLVDQHTLWEEAVKYYANILAPWSRMVDAKLREIKAMNIPIDMICTSHGASWRRDLHKIIEAYTLWANGYRENRITIAYDSMWGGTRAMAEAIAKGIRMEDADVDLVLHCLSKSDKNDVMTDVFRSKAVMIGSPSHNKAMLATVGGIMEELRGLSFKGKKAAAFGCYGWSGEAQARMSALLAEIGYEVVDEGIQNVWEPEASDLDRCMEYGRQFAVKVR